MIEDAQVNELVSAWERPVVVMQSPDRMVLRLNASA